MECSIRATPVEGRKTSTSSKKDSMETSKNGWIGIVPSSKFSFLFEIRS